MRIEIHRATDSDEMLVIEITTDMPRHHAPLGDFTFYEQEAKRFVDTIKRILPGGTFDQILIQMMAARASQLEVKHRYPKVES